MKFCSLVSLSSARGLVIAGLALACSHAVNAANPAWWSAPTTAIFDGTPANHWAVANVGQLKHVATMAKAHLEAELGPLDWTAAYSPQPSPFPFSSSGENSAPANIGQLKAVAVGFYRVLQDAGYPVRKSLLFQGVDSGEIGYYGGAWVPWNSFPLQQENYAPVNIGQLKLVFGFAVNSDGSSAFNLSAIDDSFTVGNDDGDADLLTFAIESTIGLSDTQFTTASTLDGAGEDPNVAAAMQSSGGSGPLIVLPERGFYNVQQPDLLLQKL